MNKDVIESYVLVSVITVAIVGVISFFWTYVIAYLWNEYVTDIFSGPHLSLKAVFVIVFLLYFIYPIITLRAK